MTFGVILQNQTLVLIENMSYRFIRIATGTSSSSAYYSAECVFGSLSGHMHHGVLLFGTGKLPGLGLLVQRAQKDYCWISWASGES